MEGAEPHKARFGNRSSCYESDHPGFALTNPGSSPLSGALPSPILPKASMPSKWCLALDLAQGEVEGLLRSGAVKRWVEIGGGEEPRVVNPLGVAVRASDGKKRLVLDLRYANAFMKHMPFTFETLKHAREFVNEGSWMTVSDFKSGYHHVPMHTFKDMAFEWEGEVFAFVVMPFGLKPAVYAFDLLVGVVYRCLRAWGMKLTFYIDDRLSADGRKEAARGQEGLIRRVFSLLGWYSRKKGQLEPAQVAKYTGMQIESERMIIRVPEAKIESFTREAEAARAAGEMSKREAARLAGSLLAMSPGLQLAPLFTQELYAIVREGRSWEDVRQLGSAAEEDLGYLLANIARLNGKRWFPAACGVRLWGDASEIGGGAHGRWELYGEGALEMKGLQIRLPEIPDIQWSLSQSEFEEGLSSTLREALALLKALEIILESPQRRRLLRERAIVYNSDNQGLVSGCNRMSSKVPEIGAVYRQIWRMVSEAGTELRLEWVPRPREQNQRADDLSKREDPADFRLEKEEYEAVLLRLGVGLGPPPGLQQLRPRRERQPRPSWDAFADEQSKQCEAFCARTQCARGVLVDAFCHGDRLRRPPSRMLGQLATVWAFGPPEQTGRILRWVRAHKLAAIVVYPVRTDRTWWGMLHGAEGDPDRLPVIADTHVNKEKITPGLRSPHKRRAGWPHADVRAALISYLF